MKFLLFGTGDCYERYRKWFNREDIMALLDNSPAKQHSRIDGIEVLSPEEGIELPFDAIVIMSFYVKEMRRQLMSLGVPDNRIFHFYDLHRLIYSAEIKRPIQYYGGAEEIVNSTGEAKKSVLLLSRDMMLGGPAIALYHAAEILKRRGYSIVFASMEDGPLRDRLLGLNISVIVDENLQIETMEETGWTNVFSLLLCNTINFYTFLAKRDTQIPIVWWLHDSIFFYDGVDSRVLRDLDRTNLRVCSVGPVPAKAIQEFIPDLHTEPLLYGVADEAVRESESKQRKSSKVCFVTIGYIEPRKGQDILVQAIQALPDEVRSNAVFYFVGQDSSVMAEQLKKTAEDIQQIIMTGTVDRESINHILSIADVMICPSREDPMPTVAAEAMMHSVPCIMSDVTGTAAYIQDGADGWIYESQNVRELSNKIEWCIKNREILYLIGIQARKIYEKYFSMEVFEKALIDIIDMARNF